MHKLERPKAPDCLANYQHGQDNWADVSPEENPDLDTAGCDAAKALRLL